MKIVRTLLLWIIIIIGLLAGYVVIFNPTATVNLSQDSVQAMVDKKLPFEAKKLGFTFNVPPGVVVKFQDGNTIEVTSSFNAKPPLTKTTHYEGAFTANGTLEYEARDHAFYLRNLDVTKLEGEWIFSERAKNVGTIISGLLGKDEDTEVAKEGLLEEIKQSATDFALRTLASIPVYRLNMSDPRMWVAGNALTSLTVSNETITATLEGRSLVLHILLWGALFGLAAFIAFGILLSGGAGLGTVAAGALTFGLLGN